MQKNELIFYSQFEEVKCKNIPKEFLDNDIIEKFGDEIKLIWQFCVLKNEYFREYLDTPGTEKYDMVYFRNHQQLGSILNSEFMWELLNNSSFLDFPVILHKEITYNFTFSLKSKKEVRGVRGMHWHSVNVMAYEFKDGLWMPIQDTFWNFDHWKGVDGEYGYAEIKVISD